MATRFLKLTIHAIAIHTTRLNVSPESTQADVRLLYHALRPHIALSPAPISPIAALEQDENESVWSQLLVNAVLSLLLPPEDLNNPCLQILVSEIFSEMIVRNGLAGKACEGWMYWESITKVIDSTNSLAQPAAKLAPEATVNRLEQFGLLSSDESKPTETNRTERRAATQWWDAATGYFWMTVQYITLVVVTLRAFITALANASALPPRSSRAPYRKLGGSRPTTPSSVRNGHSDQTHTTASKRPIVAMSIWSCIPRILSLDQRMPWLTGLVSLLQWLSLSGPGKICGLNGAMDR